MFCEKCGTQLQDGERFCPNCGEPAPASTASAPAGGVQNAAPQPVQPSPMPQPAPYVPGSATAAGAAQPDGKGKRKKPDGGKKPKKAVFVAAGVAVLAVVLVSVGIVVSAGNMGNFFRRTFSSPEDYYQYVESENAEALAENVSDMYNRILLSNKDLFNSAYNATVTLELDDAGKDLLQLAGMAGVDLSALDSASLGGGVAINDDMISMNLSTALNNRDFLTFILLMDIAKGKLFVQLPDLTNTYLGIDLEDEVGYSYDNFVEEWEDIREAYEDSVGSLPGQQELAKLLNKYMKIAVSCVEDVDKSSTTLRAEGVEVKCTALEVTIGARDVADMLDAILEEAEDDDDLEDFIIDLAEAFGEDGGYIYDDLLDELEWAYNDLKDVRGGNDIVMTVYVDGKGNVIGREFEADGVLISMLMPEKGGEFGYELSVKRGRNTYLSLTGSGEKDGDVIDGEFSLSCADFYYSSGGSRSGMLDILDITVESLDLATLEKGQLNGTLVISPGSDVADMVRNAVGSIPGMSMLEDISFRLTAATTDGSLTYSFNVSYDGKSVGTLTLALDKKQASNISSPSDRDVVYPQGMWELQEWAQGFDEDAILDRLGTIGKIFGYDDPEELLEELMWYLSRPYYYW